MSRHEIVSALLRLEAQAIAREQVAWWREHHVTIAEASTMLGIKTQHGWDRIEATIARAWPELHVG